MQKLDKNKLKKQVETTRKKRKALAETSIKDKALQVIEEMCCNDDFSLSKSPYAKLLVDIYTYAHVANGTCQNPHEDWVEELNKHYEAISKE